MNPSATHRRAFTLIELSIVMTIIALLIGGVFAGQSLMRAAQIRSVLTDAEAYILAVNNFRQQYRALPGDMFNAETHWGASVTDDGNLDGTITGDERFLAWQHLSLAGLVSKKFTGATGGGGTDDFVIGSNVPDSKLNGGGFSLYFNSVITATATSYATSSYGNILTFGAPVGTDAGEPINAVLNPTDAYNIDRKVDDSVPGTGKWIANLTGGGNFAAASEPYACSTDANGNTVTGTYNLSRSTIACSFFIKTGL